MKSKAHIPNSHRPCGAPPSKREARTPTAPAGLCRDAISLKEKVVNKYYA